MRLFSKLFGFNQIMNKQNRKDIQKENESIEISDLKEDFDEICNEIILPFFKDLGFNRKTLHFAKQINNITQCFNVQKSQWNSYNNSISFTFNFGFYNSDISSIVKDSELKLDFPKTYDCFIQNRIGVFSHNCNHWYSVSKIINIKKTKEQIKLDLEKVLKPIFENYTSLEKLKYFLEKDEKYISSTLSPYYLIAFYMTTNQIEKGKQIIKDNYIKSLIPITLTDSIISSDGTRKEIVITHKNQHYIDGMKKLAEKYNVEL